MQRTLALLLVMSITASACATRGRALSQSATSQPRATGRVAPPQPSSPELWRQFAEKLPAGTKVRVTPEKGGRFSGVILVADASGIVVNPSTRVPEPPRRLDYSEITNLEVSSENNLAKAAAIGAGVGAGTFLGLLMLMLAAWSD